MKNFKTFSSVIAMLICFITMAQEQTVFGIVTESSTPLPGVTVVVKGTTKGTQTDIEGKYSLKARKGDVLTFNYIGLKTQEVKIANTFEINVELEEDITVLEGVVVESYRTTSKKRSYAASTTVSAKAIESRPNSGYIQTVQSQVPGLSIASGSGTPGCSSPVVLRCSGSINSNAEPLYMVDGVPLDAESFKNLDPNKIESVTVLKDTSATSIYGNRGANGVIVINTNGLSKKELKALKKVKNQPLEIISLNTEHEDYESFVENVFESPKASPLSTFSIDVDNASYTNIRRFINNGQKVPKDAVRIEEMMNFFKYEYPQPENENPFSIHSEYSDCPWNTENKLVRIGLQGKNIDDVKLPASNFVFLIDVSGSMNATNKLPLLKESMKVLINQLRADDKVSIVVYAGAAGLVLPPTSGDKKMTIIDALDRLESGGSTAGGAGIQLAYKTAKAQFIKGGNNRVVLATDGDFNVGASSDNDMERLIEEERKSGVFLTCLGFGMGNYKDSKMETLANKGNGNYAYIDNIQEANRFLGKEFKGSMFAIAKDVKIQIEFNPTFVQAYRLIGYENRKLRPEDFKNDQIDAGELGSGHPVTALYEIVPVNTKSVYFQEVEDTKYSKVENKGVAYQNELATIKFRYKKPDGDRSIEMVNTIASSSKSLENASNDFKFTAAVAWFGLNLRDSKLVQNKSLKDIKKLAKAGLTNDEEGYKAEFIRLINGGNTFIASK
uniref:YfbK domain-containing protein n=1 Tax=Flavobacterium sp. TaxID=239 RepID=UPI00404B4F9E